MLYRLGYILGDEEKESARSRLGAEGRDRLGEGPERENPARGAATDRQTGRPGPLGEDGAKEGDPGIAHLLLPLPS